MVFVLHLTEAGRFKGRLKGLVYLTTKVNIFLSRNDKNILTFRIERV